MTLALVFRILLAVVFVGSGIGKLQDIEDSRQMVLDFGLPFTFARPIGTVLPGVELAIAAGLVVTPISMWAAWAALGLLGLFTLAVGFNLATGRRPDCHCFGPLHVATIGWRTLTRNVLLMALAGGVLLLR